MKTVFLFVLSILVVSLLRLEPALAVPRKPLCRLGRTGAQCGCRQIYLTLSLIGFNPQTFALGQSGGASSLRNTPNQNAYLSSLVQAVRKPIQNTGTIVDVVRWVVQRDVDNPTANQLVVTLGYHSQSSCPPDSLRRSSRLRMGTPPPRTSRNPSNDDLYRDLASAHSALVQDPLVYSLLPANPTHQGSRLHPSSIYKARIFDPHCVDTGRLCPDGENPFPPETLQMIGGIEIGTLSLEEPLHAQSWFGFVLAIGSVSAVLISGGLGVFFCYRNQWGCWANPKEPKVLSGEPDSESHETSVGQLSLEAQSSASSHTEQKESGRSTPPSFGLGLGEHDEAFPYISEIRDSPGIITSPDIDDEIPSAANSHHAY